MKNHWTQKECDMIIKKYKDNTAFFGTNTLSGEPLTFNSMYEMLRLRMHFGEAESMVIMASLIKCGARFI